jgi:enoyl-CoA hydratase/carnithine racemase
LDKALDDAHLLASGAGRALAAIKRSLGQWPRDPYATLDGEIDIQTELFDSEDFAEAIAAFAQRRAPVFGKER